MLLAYVKGSQQTFTKLRSALGKGRPRLTLSDTDSPLGGLRGCAVYVDLQK